VISGNEQLYPRRESLDAMWQWEVRNDQIAADKQARIARLLGVENQDTTMPSITDMAKASQVRGEIEQRMVFQRQLLATNEVTRVASKIFELLSSRLGNLGTVLDPNGALAASQRDAVDKLGSDLLLRMHAELRDMLVGDAGLKPTRSGNPGSRPGRAGAASTSRKRGRRVAKPS
jgi:hypothetical protein